MSEFQSARSAGAPRDGADRSSPRTGGRFNPREAPERLATYRSSFHSSMVNCFNPREAPERLATRSAHASGGHKLFQSARSAGAPRDLVSVLYNTGCRVSIRAKRRSASRPAHACWSFACVDVSIRAKRRSASRPKPGERNCRNNCFNPREAPERLATPLLVVFLLIRDVSIRAKRRSASRPAPLMHLVITDRFNPREAPERLATYWRPHTATRPPVSIRAKRRSASRPLRHSNRMRACCFNPREAPERLATAHA